MIELLLTVFAILFGCFFFRILLVWVEDIERDFEEGDA